MVLVNILSGLITTLVFTVLILVFDWRIGLITVCGILLYLCVVSAMEKKSALIAENTQKSQTDLIEAVLETVQGMSVVKSFNLTGKGDKKLQNALEANRKANLEVESIMTPYTAAEEAVLQIASVGMMLAVVALWAAGSMTLPNALMTLVVSFLVFSQVKLFGMGVSMLRLAGAAIDRTVETEKMPQMDENGKAVSSAAHDIVFDHVSFSYEHKEILHDISVTLPDRTTTAIVGPSGSGKTTIAKLIAGFWDVKSGAITMGGHDLKDIPSPSFTISSRSCRRITISLTTRCARTSAWVVRARRTPRLRRRRARPGARASSQGLSTAMTQMSAEAGRISPAASASASPLRAPCSRCDDHHPRRGDSQRRPGE